jgi:hypothetical protein
MKKTLPFSVVLDCAGDTTKATSAITREPIHELAFHLGQLGTYFYVIAPLWIGSQREKRIYGLEVEAQRKRDDHGETTK